MSKLSRVLRLLKKLDALAQDNSNSNESTSAAIQAARLREKYKDILEKQELVQESEPIDVSSSPESQSKPVSLYTYDNMAMEYREYARRLRNLVKRKAITPAEADKLWAERSISWQAEISKIYRRIVSNPPPVEYTDHGWDWKKVVHI